MLPIAFLQSCDMVCSRAIPPDQHKRYNSSSKRCYILKHLKTIPKKNWYTCSAFVMNRIEFLRLATIHSLSSKQQNFIQRNIFFWLQFGLFNKNEWYKTNCRWYL